VGLGLAGEAKVITTYRSLLGCNAENNLAMKVGYLAEEVGLGRAGKMKVIIKFPNVLSLELENIAHKFSYLAEEVGLGRAGAVKVIIGFPNVLGLSVDNKIAPTVRFLADEMGLGREGAADIILRCPTLIGLSIEHNLRPTLRFLVKSFPDTDVAKVTPLALYSLAGRLMPRVRLLRKHAYEQKFTASTMAAVTSATFCKKVGITMEEYNAEVGRCRLTPDWPKFDPG